MHCDGLPPLARFACLSQGTPERVSRSDVSFTARERGMRIEIRGLSDRSHVRARGDASNELAHSARFA